jgi:hypothetical protein
MAGDKRISVYVSAGELIDKITILEIKAERFHDAHKLRHVQEELEMLKVARDRAIEPSARLSELTGQLKAINGELWHIENAIRLCEQRQNFGPPFVQLARSVYRINDRRSAAKQQINEWVGSSLIEEKSYTPYE